MISHETYIKRCIELAKNGLGTTYPNPLVGSVIVHNGKIIGEGWHRKSGESHAEVIAIDSVKNKELLKESTIYVSLEPCSHFGKTPPCADLIIQHKIPRVVIGTIDPFAKVCGSGIAKLKKSGIKVEVGFLENECRELNKRFFTFHQKKRPYIILKWAQTQNGFIAPLQKKETKPVWISNEFSRQLVHKWRAEEQAIMVGTNTVLQDNPRLDIRSWTGENPIRIVLDRELKITSGFSVYDKSVKTIFITEKERLSEHENQVFEKIDFNKNVNIGILDVLYKHQIQSVIIEGGAVLLESFIKNDLWDEARVFTSDLSFEKGIKAPEFNTNKAALKNDISDNTLEYFYHTTEK
ncbi:MAG: bifunctional diaminohydroxyphosphoribosylaminopyrimidine deaminase/5-amino-6-(5-phosphoribosylamino)uracil reductase RibD [Flavobacteriaceae bacterium]